MRRCALKDSVAVAALYSWIDVPDEWIRAGTWRSAKKVLCCGDRIAFYAVIPEELPALQKHLADFAWRLPSATVFEPSLP